METSITIGRKTYEPEIVKQIISDYQAKMKLEDIWKKYSLYKDSLYEILDKSGIPRISRFDYDSEIAKNIAEDYKNENIAVEEILQKYSIGEKILYKIIKKYNLRSRKQKLTEHNAEEVLSLYENWKDANKVAKHFDVSTATVYNFLRARNIQLKPQGPVYTEAQKDSICEDYKTDILLSDLFDKHNVTQYTLKRILEERNIAQDKHERSISKELRMVSEEDKDKIVADFMRKLPTLEIYKKYSISKTTFAKIIKERDVNFGKKERVRQKLEQILPLFNSGISPEQISVQLRMGSTAVTKYIKSQGLSLAPSGSYIQKYTCDENYFETIDTSEKAQLLGMLTADGFVEDKKNTINLGLQERDISYLEFFKKSVRCDAPIRLSNPSQKDQYFNGHLVKQTQNHYKFTICNQKMKADVAKYGIVHKKTYTNSPFPPISPEFISAFCLGLIEGDGWVGYYDYDRTRNGSTTSNKYGVVGILAQTNIGDFIFDYLTHNLNIKCSYKRIHAKTQNNLHKIEIYGRENLIILYHWLYDGASFVMSRKHNKFLEILKFCQDTNFNVGTINIFDETGHRISS